MSRPVSFEPEAEEEYRESGRWYESQQPGLGAAFFDAVDEAISRIVDHPELGHALKNLPRELGVRRIAVSRFPFHVMYLELSDELRILAVAHDRRRPGYWRDRLSP